MTNDTTVLAAVDLFPTLAKLCGATLPEGYAPDGEDLGAALRGETPDADEAALLGVRPQRQVLRLPEGRQAPQPERRRPRRRLEAARQRRRHRGRAVRPRRRPEGGEEPRRRPARRREAADRRGPDLEEVAAVNALVLADGLLRMSVRSRKRERRSTFHCRFRRADRTGRTLVHQPAAQQGTADPCWRCGLVNQCRKRERRVDVPVAHASGSEPTTSGDLAEDAKAGRERRRRFPRPAPAR